MRPLKVALFCKTSPNTRKREDRPLGVWSYAVPEFTWDHFFFNNWTGVDAAVFKDYDLIFHEDAGFATYFNYGPPRVYLSIDSFLTPEHREVRHRQAAMADLILVDIDRLDAFTDIGKPVLRFPACVNDHLFKPSEKTVDIAYHCSANTKQSAPGALDRSWLKKHLVNLCKKYGWTMNTGAKPPTIYAESLGSARVTVNINRNELSRNHRTFDAMACKSALLTDPPHFIPDDHIADGIHYASYLDVTKIGWPLHKLIDQGKWEQYAAEGYNLVMARHTWAIRAQELRQIVKREFGI